MQHIYIARLIAIVQFLTIWVMHADDQDVGRQRKQIFGGFSLSTLKSRLLKKETNRSSNPINLSSS